VIDDRIAISTGPATFLMLALPPRHRNTPKKPGFGASHSAIGHMASQLIV
jgi:hypothetical protein